MKIMQVPLGLSAIFLEILHHENEVEEETNAQAEVQSSN